MASFEIPEEVIGVPLFVPSDYNFFSVEAAGMPNGDSCLVVHGDVNRAYKAFQTPQVVTPAIFTDLAVINWSMTLWLKLGALTNDTSLNLTQSLITCQTIDAAQVTAAAAHGNAAVVDNKSLFALVHQGTSGVYFRRFCGGGFNTGSAAAGSGNLTPSMWTMLTFNITSTTNCDCYVNDSATPASSGSGGIFYSQTANTLRKFCIGAYSNAVQANGRNGEWRIGKLAFHNHALNLTERSLLYHAMMD